MHRLLNSFLAALQDFPTLFADCGLVWWNFPFTGEDGDEEGHKTLMAQFFQSLGQLLVAGVLSSQVEVRLFLQAAQH